MRYLVNQTDKTVIFEDGYTQLNPEVQEVMCMYPGFKFSTHLVFPMLGEIKDFGIQRGNEYINIQGSGKPC